ncbi:hypothetical protein CLV30_10561 [Haloactinopolyspora alba]|uniref:Uncharacterized protein n=1 Tax=Haloactinopolyspora alba TaxID=648780 RepID=A0A2P8E591_9ACTN|nr:hypothetical protein [Haloactinopolyspora alba]PSL04597.1 hypothetical protein CLV30_10561 [Haloactinopolyspora alba]
MNVAAIILTAAAAIAGGGWWLLTERRTALPGTTHVVTAAAVPALLLGVAALAGLAGEEAGDNVVTLASVTAVVAAASCGGIVATALLRLADHSGRGAEQAVDDVDATGASAPIDTRAATVAAVSDPRTLRGGAAIGVLERVAVTATLLAGWPEGLALVLGMKGLGRFPELNRPPASERFIIGTLGSVLWAIAAAGVVHALRT